ncbi:NAD(P)/FAD-dependent oxidoreductase [Caldisalinibacter kiritimatiensis]|uniref:Sarcosine oxidase alpha subunit n=1 Tax=Caldisalinibacter kiritimatiensis TaxID=1304284 RepID=R1CYT2_9FIRM|nr:NAD(P)/FAD-dependent oxidoreductase [Caldisalinibacter kiritimatiensis]EOD01744.1 Sarcosine oxidase alpha subunit [Caldisalinibacter kiritimatiensis]
MTNCDIAVIGGGPAGLCAAINAASSGADTILIDKNKRLGGQLIKQTHMFFGSEKQFASKRGFDIAEILLKKVINLRNKIKIMNNSTVLGLYEDGVITVESNGKYKKIKPKAIIVATGASEKVLAFPNSDLPGIYGAGAVQTLMNVYGVKPGNEVLMVGAGNIGLIVSYQLLQAGVNVKAIIDAAPKIGGYLVHASKIARMGVPIYTGYTVKKAVGNEALEKVIICKVDANWSLISGTEIELNVDVMCISVGLMPLNELLFQAGCEMMYISELGGQVPIRDENYETTRNGVFVAGDVCGIEEASSAMVEGYLAGLCAAKSIGYVHQDFRRLKVDYEKQLMELRGGPYGTKIRKALKKIKRGVN